MRRFAVGGIIIIAALAAAPGPAAAQIGIVEVHFGDSPAAPTVGYCKGFGVLDTLAVVASHFDMLMSTIEFSIEGPSYYAAWIGDVHLPGSLHLGMSQTGVTITYPIPLNAFQPVTVMYYAIIYLCSSCNCQITDLIRVKPHPGTGLLQAIEWQTFRQVDGVGFTSLMCYCDPTEPSTWGRIKSLYR